MAEDEPHFLTNNFSQNNRTFEQEMLNIAIQMYRDSISEILLVFMFLYPNTIFQPVSVFQYWDTFLVYSLYRDTILGRCISLQ